MADKIISDVNGLEPGDLIELFELDISTGVAPIIIKKTISGATQANPIVITTSTAHELENGDKVSISNVVGMTQLNGNTYTVAGKTSTTFQLSGINGTSGYTAYTSGGNTTKIIDFIFRWHSGYNENLQEIVWKGDIYSAFPIEAEGFEWSGKGAIPRPTLTVANITSLLSAILGDYQDLVGSKVTRKRTFAKYLDAYCYVGGNARGGVCSAEAGGSPYSLSKSDCENTAINGGAGTWTVYISGTCGGIWYANATADNTADFAEDIWYVDRKAEETRMHLKFELTAAHDVEGIKLPGRTIISNLCPWLYKGTECGYDVTKDSGGDCSIGNCSDDDYTSPTACKAAGETWVSTYTTQATCTAEAAIWTPNYFKKDNISTSNAFEDVCSKNFIACEKRFPEKKKYPMPFGGFPGAGMKQ